MSLRLIIVLLLSLLLSTSSFSLINTLSKLFTSSEYQQNPEQYNRQYLLGLSLGLPSAQYQHLKELPLGSNEWRQLAEKLARHDADIAWQLSQHYADTQQQRDYQYWHIKSVELGSAKALITDIKLNLKNHPDKAHYLKAKTSLSPLINNNDEALLLSTHLAIEYNDLKQLQYNVEKLNTVKGRQLQNLISRYKVVTSSRYLANHTSHDVLVTERQSALSPFSCQNKVQFFATSIHALSRLEQKIALITVDPFFSQKFCFTTPRFIAKSDLNCLHTKSDRIQCDESIWQSKNIEADVKYLGVLVDKGGANVNHGILYIDELDSHHVIEHELMHLIGFIDEYPLHTAHQVCAKTKSMAIANNVLLNNHQYYDNEQEARITLLQSLPWRDLIAADTPLTTPENINNVIRYKIGTPETHKHNVGVFPADTCNNHGISTFKPLSITTKLEYFEENLPEPYKQLSINSADEFNMPSYQYNVGLSLIEQNKSNQASKWFVESAKLEKNEQRQKIISQGGF